MVDKSLLEEANGLLASSDQGQNPALKDFLLRLVRVQSDPVKEELLDGLSIEDALFTLSGPYFRLYYVDLNTDRFIRVDAKNGEWMTKERYAGEDFFRFFASKAYVNIFPSDVAAVIRFLDRDAWRLAKPRTALSLTHRSLEFGVARYHTIRAVKDEKNHLFVGIANADESYFREKELRRKFLKAKDESNIDVLTGLPNRRYYDNEKKRIDNRIRRKSVKRFAIAVCDANDLKKVNDTLGHQAGDEYLLAGAERLRLAFEPCKVCRIGGDEFAVILEGEAYEKREMIVADLIDDSFKAKKDGGCVMAVGLATFLPETDADFSSVFLRADMAMFENKSKLKSI